MDYSSQAVVRFFKRISRLQAPPSFCLQSFRFKDFNQIRKKHFPLGLRLTDLRSFSVYIHISISIYICTMSANISQKLQRDSYFPAFFPAAVYIRVPNFLSLSLFTFLANAILSRRFIFTPPPPPPPDSCCRGPF